MRLGIGCSRFVGFRVVDYHRSTCPSIRGLFLAVYLYEILTLNDVSSKDSE